jgi:hypothetical protein
MLKNHSYYDIEVYLYLLNNDVKEKEKIPVPICDRTCSKEGMKGSNGTKAVTGASTLSLLFDWLALTAASAGFLAVDCSSSTSETGSGRFFMAESWGYALLNVVYFSFQSVLMEFLYLLPFFRFLS